jgi:hypothetical protein
MPVMSATPSALPRPLTDRQQWFVIGAVGPALRYLRQWCKQNVGNG